jgi:carboxypeptidase PM20D1
MSDIPEVADKLSHAVRFRTVSYGPERRADRKELRSLYAYLKRAFPGVHRALDLKPLGERAMLYEWAGSDASLPAALFVAHTDVVPAEPADRWTHPPFAGEIAEGCVWGRGTLDTKHTVVALLLAVEELLEQGFVPARSVCLAFGADEEIDGRQGARLIAADLRQRAVRLDCVIDEGGVILEDLLPRAGRPVGLIGITEKGQFDLELLVRSPGGHAAMPPPRTAVGILGEALALLESRPLPPRLTPAVRQFLKSQAEILRGPRRWLFRNLWLTGPLVLTVMASSPDTASLVRSTRAPTMLEGSEKENVLAREARAVINVRSLSGDSVASLTRRTARLFQGRRFRAAHGGSMVEVRVLDPESASEAVPESPLPSPAWNSLVAALARVYPEAYAAPFVFTMATDSRHYRELCPCIYRFNPVVLKRAGLEMIHGVDERIPIDGLVKLVEFYRIFIRSHCGKEGSDG